MLADKSVEGANGLTISSFQLVITSSWYSLVVHHSAVGGLQIDDKGPEGVIRWL